MSKLECLPYILDYNYFTISFNFFYFYILNVSIRSIAIYPRVFKL